MIQVKNLLIGAIAFVAVHFALVATWSTWFQGGGHDVWFMNSSLSVAFAAAVFAAISFVLVLAGRDARLDAALLSGLNISVGATIAMVIVLFRLPGGSGNLFPLAIVIGFLVIAVCGAAGAIAGWGVRSLFAGRARPTNLR